jgi:leukotriene-A4 hydrolase
MSRIKDNPRFLDFDAIEGRKAMTDSIQSMTPKHTCLVLDIGDDDPDDSYSIVSYEKGFTFLLYLERLVGTPKFEAFFQAYVKRFAAQTLTSDDFKSFFLEHFADSTDKVKEVDWDVWFYAEGMPPVLPPLDQSMARSSQDLAHIWIGVDRRGQAPPSKNEMISWSSLQIVCFLDALQVESATTPLRISTLLEMDELYHLASSTNSEILMRYCELAIRAEDASILPIAIRFITTQGRMKFVRPLYKLLYQSEMGNELAVTTFLQHKDFYHPICAKMVAIDLKVAGTKESQQPLPPTITFNQWVLTGAAVLASGIVMALLRGKRN